ncbi:MAG: Ig-like domain-containing protein [Nitrospirota bacterium]
MEAGRLAGKIVSGLFVIAVLAAAGGCAKGSGDSNGSGGGSTGIPRVINTDPADGAINVLVNNSIEVTFSEPMDEAAVQEAFTLYRKSTDEPVTGTIIYTDDVILFTPDLPLEYSTAANPVTYVGTVSTAAKDLQGLAMGSSHVWTFQTQLEPDKVGKDVPVTSYTITYPAGFIAFNFSSGQCSIGIDETTPQTTVFSTWYDSRNDTGSGNRDIFFAEGTEDVGGNYTFGGENVRVNDDTGAADQKFPCLAVVPDGNLYIVWDDARNGNSDIYFSRSLDGGSTWDDNVKVNWDDATNTVQSAPAIAVGENGIIYVVWRDGRDGVDNIYFSKSGDQGTTFGENVKVNDQPRSFFGHTHPSIGVSPDGLIAVVWRDNRNATNPDADNTSDIYFAKSTNGGVSFDANLKVNDDLIEDDDGNLVVNSNNTFQHDPTVRVQSNGNILVAWVDLKNQGNADIYFSRSTDSGISFEQNIRVNDSANIAGEDIPSMAVNSNGTIVIAWQDSRKGDLDIYMARSYYLLDGQLAFGVSQRVNGDYVSSGFSDSTRQFDVNVALDGLGNAYLTWADQRWSPTPDAEQSPGDIYFSKVTPAAP